ncbi:MAG TPA: hypothetical protein VGH19_18040 [Verrucomicrobiae bacterium]
MWFILEIILAVGYWVWEIGFFPRFYAVLFTVLSAAVTGDTLLRDDSGWRALGAPMVVAGVIAGVIWEWRYRRERDYNPPIKTLNGKVN